MFARKEIETQNSSFAYSGMNYLQRTQFGDSRKAGDLLESDYSWGRNLGSSYIQSIVDGGQTAGPATTKNSSPMIQRKYFCGGNCAKEDEDKRIQAKLKIGPANDVYEQEADKVAEQMMRMPEPEGRAESDYPPLGMQFQRLSEGDSTGLATDVNLNQSSGRPLSPITRNFMEPRFGINFSHVRLNTDKHAQQTASQIQARAFTYGNDIWLGEGESEHDFDLMVHELTHVVQQNNVEPAEQKTVSINKSTRQSEQVNDTVKNRISNYEKPVHTISRIPLKLQRAVREQPQEQIQQGADVCMVHLHGNEENALEVGRRMYGAFCANLVFLNNTDRCIRVDVPGSSGRCFADANRIFSTDSVTEANAFTSCSCPTSLRPRAVAELRQFHDQRLAPAISRCRGGSGTGLSGPLPVVALHNNTTPGALSIRSYRPGGSEASATETDPIRLGGATNPSISGSQDPDNFLLVTNPSDFAAFRGSRNVVLQSTVPTNDGSLSVALANEHYVNVEAQGKTFVNDTHRFFVTNRRMAEEVFRQLGVGQQPCNDQRQSENSESIMDEILNLILRVWDWIRRLMREMNRVIEQWETMPQPLTREAPPANLPSNCLTFNRQTDLDSHKNTWASIIASMPTNDVVKWIIGVDSPPTAVTQESIRQREDCLLHSIREAARQPGSGISLPSTPLSRSGRRGFVRQRQIWESKFNFNPSRSPFDRITDHARRTCGTLIQAGETRWNPREPRHRVCWNVSPLSGMTAPNIPSGARPLNNNERQVEILQASSAPGISRHHFGTDFDLFDPDMNPAEWEAGRTFADEYSWLRRNASTYGFIQTFTATSTFMRMGYIEERWHWSYFPIAQALLEFANTHQNDLESELLRRWGTSPQYSFIRQHWRDFMFNVSEVGIF